MQPNVAFARWAIPLGVWAGVRVRLNVWFPLILLLFAHWVGWQLGFVCTLALLVSVLIHEFAHILAVRLTGGDGDEILVWPLGGLAFCNPGPTFRSQFVTPAAGPISHLVICLLTLPVVLQSQLLGAALTPTILPIAELSRETLLRDILLVTFSLNWVLLLLNLIPAFPLDGGQMLQAVLTQRVGPAIARQVSVQVGFASGLALAIAGLFLDHTTIVFLGFMLVNMNVVELFRLQVEETFGGEYAASGGSPYDDEEDDVRPPRVSLWQRWKQQRAAARQERELEARAKAARRLDELLDKVHHLGMQSLTGEERKFLEQTSSKFRTQQEGKS